MNFVRWGAPNFPCSFVMKITHCEQLFFLWVGVSLTLRYHTNTNLTKWSVFTGGYGAEISGSHQNQIFTEWAFFQPRRQQPSLKQTNRKYGLAKSGKRRGRDIETFCCTISKSWASILPCPEINYPLAPWPLSPQHLRPSHSLLLIF